MNLSGIRVAFVACLNPLFLTGLEELLGSNEFQSAFRSPVPKFQSADRPIFSLTKRHFHFQPPF